MKTNISEIATEDLRFVVSHWLMVAERLTVEDRPGGAICREHGTDCPGESDELCNDCGEPIVWNEEIQDFRHVEPGRTCFLIQTPA